MQIWERAQKKRTWDKTQDTGTGASGLLCGGSPARFGPCIRALQVWTSRLPLPAPGLLSRHRDLGSACLRGSPTLCQACFFSRKGKSRGLTSSLSGPGPTFSRPPLCSASTASSLKGSSCLTLQHGCGESAGDGWGQGTAYDLHIGSRPGVLSYRSCLHWSCQGLGLSEFLSRLKNGTHLSLTLVFSQPKSVLTLGQKEPWSGHCYCVAYRNLELPGF